IWRLQGGEWHPVRVQNGAATSVNILLEDQVGHIWAATTLGLLKRTELGDSFVRASSSFVPTYGLTQDAFGDMWVTHANSVSTVAGSDRQEIVRLADEVRAFRTIQDHDHNLWVGTFGSGLFRVPMQAHHKHALIQRFTTQDGLSGDLVFALFEDRE